MNESIILPKESFNCSQFVYMQRYQYSALVIYLLNLCSFIYVNFSNENQLFAFIEKAFSEILQFRDRFH